MKLIQKLTKSNILVFFIEGEVQPDNLRVLQAGIAHRIKAGNKKMILDMTQIKNTKPEVIKDLANLRHIALKADAHLVVVSTVPKVGDVKTLAEALQFAGNRREILSATMKMYKDRLDEIPIEKKRLEDELLRLRTTNAEIDALIKANRSLKETVVWFDRALSVYEGMIDPNFQPNREYRERMDRVDNVLYQVLQREGFKFSGGG
ncbi:MAG: hypothetical protein AAB425_09595 [Bdellovibrionota bacterium]